MHLKQKKMSMVPGDLYACTNNNISQIQVHLISLLMLFVLALGSIYWMSPLQRSLVKCLMYQQYRLSMKVSSKSIVMLIGPLQSLCTQCIHKAYIYWLGRMGTGGHHTDKFAP